MMTHKTAALMFSAVACLVGPGSLSASTQAPLSGGIAGAVSSPTGAPQMGASVILFNAQQRQVGKVSTDERGEFKLLGLVPAAYTVKVMAAALAPVTKQILVQPGMRSVLAVHLTTIFSTIQFASPPIANGNIMTDEWKWVLRSAAAARPILRFTGDNPSALPSASDVALNGQPAVTERTAAFSDTRAMLKVSGGQGPLSTGVGNQADLGTAFALATSLYGKSSLQVSGNLGYGSTSGAPTAAFRTSYSRELAGGTPEVSLTMRQMFLPGRQGAALSGVEPGALPMIRTMSAGFDDRTRVADGITLQYGLTLESVAFLDHLNYFSPYARLVYDLGDGSEVDFAYSSGNARPNLDGGSVEDSDLQRGINALGVFPLISLRDSRAHIQRGNEYQITYVRRSGPRTYRASVYRQDVGNLAVTMVAPAGMFAAGDVLPDMNSGSSVFNAGGFQSVGYTLAVTQDLTEDISATLIYGDTGALIAANRALASNNPDELRSMIGEGRRRAATMRVSAKSHWTGAHLTASYQWANNRRAVMAGNLYAADSFQPAQGLNVFVRQPIPGFGKRVEATADVRNILAQGYLPISAEGGQKILLVQNPRSVRGGLSFVF